MFLSTPRTEGQDPETYNATFVCTILYQKMSDLSYGNTVKFDDSGTVYKVSKLLLKQHPDTMMARLTSDNWSQSDGVISTKSLFIERDGERFRYCLDYMRDGGIVHLPPTVPKASLLQDFEYYGF